MSPDSRDNDCGRLKNKVLIEKWQFRSKINMKITFLDENTRKPKTEISIAHSKCRNLDGKDPKISIFDQK